MIEQGRESGAALTMHWHISKLGEIDLQLLSGDHVTSYLTIMGNVGFFSADPLFRLQAVFRSQAEYVQHWKA